MLKASDCKAFLQTQIQETRGLGKMSVFQYKHISALPSHAKLLSLIWIYRCKHHPNGVLLKRKTRLCIDGSQQLHGRNNWGTYAPVVWSTVCWILLLSTILGLKSHQEDYKQPFPQAELTTLIFMCLP
jgi:hypothetical protein